jgi:hypothetical protein
MGKSALTWHWFDGLHEGDAPGPRRAGLAGRLWWSFYEPDATYEGLVDLAPNRGATVAQLSPAEADEIYIMRIALEPVIEQQGGRQGHEAGQALRKTQRHLQRDRSTLRESGHDDALRRNPARNLTPYQHGGLDDAVRYAPLIVIAAGRQAHDVVPGAHRHAAIDGHRAHRCMRKHVPNVRRSGPGQFRDQGFEIVPVRAQAVQPDDRRRRLGAGSQLDGFERNLVPLAACCDGG